MLGQTKIKPGLILDFRPFFEFQQGFKLSRGLTWIALIKMKPGELISQVVSQRLAFGHFQGLNQERGSSGIVWRGEGFSRFQ